MENKKVTLQELADVISAQAGTTKRFTDSFLRELVVVIQEYLEKDGVNPINPTEFIDRPKVNKTLPQTLSIEEVDNIAKNTGVFNFKIIKQRNTHLYEAAFTITNYIL